MQSKVLLIYSQTNGYTHHVRSLSNRHRRALSMAPSKNMIPACPLLSSPFIARPHWESALASRLMQSPCRTGQVVRCGGGGGDRRPGPDQFVCSAWWGSVLLCRSSADHDALAADKSRPPASKLTDRTVTESDRAMDATTPLTIRTLTRYEHIEPLVVYVFVCVLESRLG